MILRFIKFKYLLFSLLVGCSFSGNAQYPFEAFPKPNYKVFDTYFTDSSLFTSEMLDVPFSYNIMLDDDSTKISFAYCQEEEFCPLKSIILIKRFGKRVAIYKSYLDFGVFGHGVFPSIQVADLNKDGLSDLKLSIRGTGNGFAGFYNRQLFLYQTKENGFKCLSYLDLIGEERTERDFNKDGKFEHIVRSFTNVNGHAYWIYNLYSFKGDALVNVNYLADYPILIPYLNKPYYKVTTKISRKEMKKYVAKKPEDYKYVALKPE